MNYLLRLFVCLLCLLTVTSGDTYSVKIHTEYHVNVVDRKFLSFTIDPKYLFSNSDKYNSKECLCMANSMTPAYLRIAGPSTAHMSFHNATISITDEDGSKNPKRLVVEYRQWKKFLQWANTTGFNLVFALNNEEKMVSGIWDPNTALNILTVAEKAKIGDIFWQLGYECNNQSIEEYLNDMETLRVITETFEPGKKGAWSVVGGDVTGCLHQDSKSDFKDYLILSTDMMDAVMLDGNSSSQELERMSARDRNKLIKLLTKSTTPLWLSEGTQKSYSEMERAADWLISLGFSARNGFSVHFRELLDEEMYEPSLSFYMALLFKNLVGERVLNVEMEPKHAILFAHCTSLRHKPVPGAVTIYGANMDEEPARLSLKLSKREEGGDIMQFILGHDISGNIIVNGRAMFYEGDIKPVVKRVRPYKTLLINLPPKSFGFWVLANTNVEACQELESTDKNQSFDTISITDKDISIKRKRSINLIDLLENNKILNTANEVSNDLLTTITNQLRNPLKIPALVKRARRHTQDNEIGKGRKKLRKLKTKADRKFKGMESISKRLFGNLTNRNIIKNKYDRKRKHRNIKNKDVKSNSNKFKSDIKIRERRSVVHEKLSEEYHDVSAENEINVESKENMKLLKILRKINKELQDLSDEKDVVKVVDNDKNEPKNKDPDDSASFDISDLSRDSDSGFIKSTVNNLMTILSDLNKNLNRFWSAITLLE